MGSLWSDVLRLQEYPVVQELPTQQFYYPLMIPGDWLMPQRVKNRPPNAGDTGDSGLVLGLGRFPGGGHGNSLQYILPGEYHGQRSLAGDSPKGPCLNHLPHRWLQNDTLLSLSFRLHLLAGSLVKKVNLSLFWNSAMNSQISSLQCKCIIIHYCFLKNVKVVSVWLLGASTGQLLCPLKCHHLPYFLAHKKQTGKKPLQAHLVRSLCQIGAQTFFWGALTPFSRKCVQTQDWVLGAHCC